MRFESAFVDAVEIGHETEEVILTDRVEFMVVAAGATDRHSHDSGAVGADAVNGIFDQPFLGDGTALVIDAMIAIERRGNFLLEGGIG